MIYTLLSLSLVACHAPNPVFKVYLSLNMRSINFICLKTSTLCFSISFCNYLVNLVLRFESMLIKKRRISNTQKFYIFHLKIYKSICFEGNKNKHINISSIRSVVLTHAHRSHVVTFPFLQLDF